MRALVFDSGVGGLTVAQAIRDLMPELIVDYAADSAFFPYGQRSDEELQQRLPEICSALVAHTHADILVIACNTASTLSLPAIRERVTCGLVGTVPAIRPAALMTKTGVIGVLATPGTVRRAYLDDLIRDFAADKTVLRQGSSRLVEIAEAAVAGGQVDVAGVAKEVGALFAQPGGSQIDVVVLGCTHFPLIRDAIAAACPTSTLLVDTGEAIARQVKRVAAGVKASDQAQSDAPQKAYVTGISANAAALRPALERFDYLDVEAFDPGR